MNKKYLGTCLSTLGIVSLFSFLTKVDVKAIPKLGATSSMVRLMMGGPRGFLTRGPFGGDVYKIRVGNSGGDPSALNVRGGTKAIVIDKDGTRTSMDLAGEGSLMYLTTQSGSKVQFNTQTKDGMPKTMLLETGFDSVTLTTSKRNDNGGFKIKFLTVTGTGVDSKMEKIIRETDPRNDSTTTTTILTGGSGNLNSIARSVTLTPEERITRYSDGINMTIIYENS